MNGIPDKSQKNVFDRLKSALRPESSTRKYLNLIIVLILGIIGYILGPRDLALGKYTAQIEITQVGQTISVVYPFLLSDEAGETRIQTYVSGEKQVLVKGLDMYEYGLDKSITFQVKMVDSSGQLMPLKLDEVTSIIDGENYQQVLPPTSRSDDWLVFTMRVPYKAKVSTGLLFAVGTMWLTELVPLAAASLLIPVVMVSMNVTGPETVLQSFFHPIVVLFFAGFLLAEGMHRTGIDRIIALNILKRASSKPIYLMGMMMVLTAFLSMWMSNTASVAIIIPIALAILGKITDEGSDNNLQRALVLGIAYAATVGGIGSAIGTPANVLAMTFLNDFTGTQLGFADWFYYGLPIVFLMVPIIWFYLAVVFRVKSFSQGESLSRDIYDQELKKSGRLNKDQRLILLVFVAIMALWLTDRWHQIHAGIIALGGVLVLFFTETIKQKDLSLINWNALLTFGGGLALGNMMILTGVSDWIALKLTGLAQFPPLLVVFLVSGLTLLIGAFISNTACAAMLIPLAIPLAQILHMDPRLLVVVVAIASSIDFALVVGTPPTMMAYSTGLFDARDIFKKGIVLDIIGILVLSFGVIWIWQLLGVITL